MIITIQSANRPENVPAMEAALKSSYGIIWCVPDNQKRMYENAGAKHVIGIPGQLPMKAKQLNYALEFAFRMESNVVTMDDDFIKCVTITKQGNKYIRTPASLINSLELLNAILLATPYYVAGFQSNMNPSWCLFETTFTGMLLGQCLIHKPNPIRFDENLTMLEDLDYIINHHITHKGVVRNNDQMIFYHMENAKSKHQAGGYKGHRTKEAQTAAVKYIKEKYNHRYGLNLTENAEVGVGLTKQMKWKKLCSNQVV